VDRDKKGIAVTAALSLAYTLSGLAIIAYCSSSGVACGLTLVLIGSDIDFTFRLGNIQKLFSDRSKED
jgi:hypothetical protein